MRTTLLTVILAVGVTAAADQPIKSNDGDSIRTERMLLDSGQEGQIKDGFDAATHLFDKMDKLDFGGVAGALVGSISSFLGAVGPFVGFVLSFFSGPSPEFVLMKRLFTRVEDRFDKVDVQFAHLRRQVAFVPTQVHFTTLESNINAVLSELKVLSKVKDKNGYRSAKREFIHTYDRTYASSGIKLFNAIVHGGHTTGGVFHEFLAHSAYDRKQTERFMIGTVSLLMKAAQLEMTYAQLKGDPNIAIRRSTWISHFSRIKSKMLAIDKEAASHYHTQMVQDIDDLAALHPKSGGVSNSDFSNQLYHKLTTKYYWRDWFVLVSTPYETRTLVTHACEYNQHDKNGRTIAVASVDKKKHHIGNSFTLMHYNMKLYIESHRPPGHVRYLCSNANDAYNHMPDSVRNHCSTYTAAGVVCTSNTDIHIHASSGRLTSYIPHGANKAFLFG